MKKSIEIEVPDGFKEQINTVDGKVVIDFVKVESDEDKIRKYLLDWINGCNITIIRSYNPNLVSYVKNDEDVFVYNRRTGSFFVSNCLWSFLQSSFNLSFPDVRKHINAVIAETLGITEVDSRPLWLNI